MASHRLRLLLLLFMALQNTLVAQTWTGSGPYSKIIRTIIPSPSNENILYAGAFGWGVFKSTDGGASWVNQKTGMSNTYVRSLLALSDLVVFAGTNDGVFKTTNGGSSWSLSLSTMNSIRSIDYDAGTNSLYAASYGQGLYKSLNQGGSWTPVTVSDPVSSQTLLHQRAVAVFTANSLYVGGSISDIGTGGALFKSVNGGTTWVQVQRDTGIRSSVLSIALNPSAPATGLIIGTAAKGTYRSTNAGTNWSSLDGTTTTHPLVDQQVNAVAFNPTQYYAATDSTGMFYFRTVGDATTGWLSGTGLPGSASPVKSLRILTTTSTILAGTGGQGVYRSINSGTTWQPLNAGMLGVAGRVLRINGNGNIIMGTDFGDGIWLSTNQAVTWTKAETLSTSNSITAIGTTNNPSILYACAYGTGVFKSLNGGNWWSLTDTAVINDNVRTLAVHPTDPNTMYAGTGNGVFKSVDGGTTWLAANTGIPSSTSIRSMSLDASSPGIVFVGTDSSYMFKTVNGGSNWANITSASGFLSQDRFIRCITIDNTSPARVYVGSDSGRVYRSEDGGSSWNLLSKISSVNSVRSILLSPNNRNVLFAATFGSGVFVSADTGAHWAPLNTGLPDLEVYTLESDQANPLHLYIGTGKSGVFRTTYTLNQSTTLNVQEESGWNLVSVPLRMTDYAKSTVYPTSISSAFSYNGTYVPRDTLDNGPGYWLKFPSPQTVALTGIYFAGDTITVQAGWNLVGSVSSPVPFANVTPIPPMTITSPFFRFSGGNGYVPADTLDPGKSYWVKVDQTGQLVLSGGTPGSHRAARKQGVRPPAPPGHSTLQRSHVKS